MKPWIIALIFMAAGIAPLQADDLHIKLSPNPASTYVNIEFQTPAAENCTVELFSVLGTLVQKQEYISNSGINTVQMHTSGLSDGIYLVRVTANGTSSVKRLKIQQS